MTRIAVVAHAGKTLDGGLPELRRALARARRRRSVLGRGAEEPQGAEAGAPRAEGGRRADLRLGRRRDGAAVRRRRRRAKARIAIIPAGTANLLATNLGIPGRSRARSRSASRGRGGARRRARQRRGLRRHGRRRLRRAHDRRRRRRPEGPPRARRLHLDRREEPPGEAVRREDRRSTAPAGSRARRAASCSATSASCSAASRCSTDARPDDGRLELGVVTADGAVQWLRTLARAAVGSAERSPYARTTEARSVRIKLDRKVLYELDGGDRKKVKSLRVEVEPRRARGLRADAA